VGDVGGEEAVARSHVQGGTVAEDERMHRIDVPSIGRLVKRGPASCGLAVHERRRAFELAVDGRPIVPFRGVEESVLSLHADLSWTGGSAAAKRRRKQNTQPFALLHDMR
jgi:hypothetical protein